MNKIIIALDVSSKQEAQDLITKLTPPINFYKIGLQLYLAEGPQLVKQLKSQRLKVFLDLKLHDIPNTVARAASEIAKLKPDMITVHTFGGLRMLQAAVSAAKDIYPEVKVLGVTVLTSLADEDLKRIGWLKNVDNLVLELAQLASDGGCDGIVCSAKDIPHIKKKHPSLLTVSPGIRLPGDETDDQKRVVSTTEAIKAGADYLVIGRSLTKRENLKQALDTIEYN